jgi:hypothetical protein
MALDQAERDALQTARIRAEARVNPISQTNGNYVLRGTESGGGTKTLGHYVGFVPLAGIPFIKSSKLTLLGVNSLHRRVVASVMVRFEVFRYRTNYVHAFITLHRASTDNAGKAHVTRQTLFRGKYGELDSDDNATFLSEDGGDDITVPSFLMDGFKAALAGSRCTGKKGLGCQDAGHFESVGTLQLPDTILSALHLRNDATKQAESARGSKAAVAAA